MHYSESDTRAKYIDPALRASGWQESMMIREYAFTAGRKFVGGRGKQKYTDYLLRHQGKHLAIIEAKKYSLPPTEGLEQVKEYGKLLSVRWVYSTNGRAIYEYDLDSGRGTFLDSYPTPDELYRRTTGGEDQTRAILLRESSCLTSKRPRYYQDIAITRTMEAIAAGQSRILLALATGTGKTVIAFQIVYRLFSARWSREAIVTRRPRILILADRNILVDQAMNTFNPLEKDCLKIDGSEIRRRGGTVPTNANIFFSIYQALVGGVSEEHPDEILESYYRRYDPDFFDLIIIDECHRGGARQDGNWAEILRYFSSAVQIGMTATPKRTDNIDTYQYFGDPIYEYSLAQGIDDGFLTPFRIQRIKSNLDELALTTGDRIIQGEAKKSVYTTTDYDRTIIVDDRTDLIARTIIEQIRPTDKTIVFCVDQSHALRMRDALDRYKMSRDPDYCVRVTSAEGDIGRAFLERFQDNDKLIPTILTSSQMLTTGVDALNVRNIVLVRNIGSIVEYKQIIGRGTRVYEGKDFFTIIDFVGATNRFLDEIWDGGGEITEVTEGVETLPVIVGGDPLSIPPEPEDRETREKLIVELDSGREVKILDIETRYLDPETGRLLSSRDFLLRLVGRLPTICPDESRLRQIWSDPDTRESLLAELATLGIGADQLADLTRMLSAEDSDIFDILAYIAYGTERRSRLDRRELALGVLDEYQDLGARDFLDWLLSLYVRNGIRDFRRDGLSRKIELYGRTPADLARVFGGNAALKRAYYRIQEGLYVR